jgi:hypothetical protein
MFQHVPHPSSFCRVGFFMLWETVSALKLLACSCLFANETSCALRGCPTQAGFAWVGANSGASLTEREAAQLVAQPLHFLGSLASRKRFASSKKAFSLSLSAWIPCSMSSTSTRLSLRRRCFDMLSTCFAISRGSVTLRRTCFAVVRFAVAIPSSIYTIVVQFRKGDGRALKTNRRSLDSRSVAPLLRASLGMTEMKVRSWKPMADN